MEIEKLMPTKSELESKIIDLEHQLASAKTERGMFTTELGKLALEYNLGPLMEFLNFTPEELEDLK